MQQSAGVLPAGLAVDDAVRAIPSGGGEIETGQLLPFGPADEVPGLAATGSVLAAQPAVEIALPGAAEFEMVGGEPVQQRDRGSKLLLDADDLSVGGVPPVVAPPQPMQCVPDGVAVQQGPLLGIIAFGDGGRDPVLEADEVFVARRQRGGGDQDAAQVPDRFRVG